MRVTIGLYFLLSCVAPFSAAPAQSIPAVPTIGEWEKAPPTSLGVDTAGLREHRALCESSGADACVVIRKGHLVDEWRGPQYREPLYAMSSTKSISNLLIGILIDQGRVRLDDSVSRFIPQWKAGAAAGVTIRHLLSMTSGIPDNRSVQDVGTVEDKEALVFGMALATTPGSTWAYSNNGAFLLSPIIKAAAGESVASFAERNLFQPLGMRDTRMHVYPEGQAWTHADMETTPGDLARIGQLMLDRGVWRGRRIVSSQWVDSSLTRSQAQVPYGLMWWLNIPNGFAARGYRETNVYVFPRQELVIVRMQNNSSESYTRYEEQALRIFARLASTVR